MAFIQNSRTFVLRTAIHQSPSLPGHYFTGSMPRQQGGKESTAHGRGTSRGGTFASTLFAREESFPWTPSVQMERSCPKNGNTCALRSPRPRLPLGRGDRPLPSWTQDLVRRAGNLFTAAVVDFPRKTVASRASSLKQCHKTEAAPRVPLHALCKSKARSNRGHPSNT